MSEENVDSAIRAWLLSRPVQDGPGGGGEGRGRFAGWDEWGAAAADIPEYEPRLAAALREDPDPVLRAAAAQAIGRLGLTSASGRLVEALSLDLPFVASEAASALGSLGAATAIGPLCAAMRHADANVRGSAATALGTLGGERAIQCLRDARNDEDSLVRAAADEGLRRLESKDAG